MRGLATIALLLLLTCDLVAQQPDTSVYRIEVMLTGAPCVTFFNEPRYEGEDSDPRLGGLGHVRVMWHPDRNLAVGILTGYTLLSQETIPSIHDSLGGSTTASLETIPLQAVVTMQSERLEAGLGMGPFLTRSTILDPVKARGQRLELGLTFMINYRFQIAEDLYLAPEFRVLYLHTRGVLVLAPAITLRWDAYSY